MKKKNNTHNSVPSIVFTPFKTSKKISLLFSIFSFILSLIILFFVLFDKLSFNQEELNGLADFTLNFVFVVAALGLTIFTLPINTKQPEKNKVIFSYIGTTLQMASISLFSYILSFCDFLNISIFKHITVFSLYFCAMLLLMCRCITSILSAIIAYFDIRD